MIGPLENMREKVALDKRKKAEEIRALKKQLKGTDIYSTNLRRESPHTIKIKLDRYTYDSNRRSIGCQMEGTLYKDASQSTDNAEKDTEFSSIILPDSPIKVPIYIPQSLLRKVQKLPPPTYHKALPSGEVITIHMIGQDTPTNDPILKLEVLIDPRTLQLASSNKTPTYKGSNIDYISRLQTEACDSSVYSGARSLSPKRNDTQTKLTPVPDSIRGVSVREVTPSVQASYVNFRDFAIDEIKTKPERSWVNKRMQEYYEGVKSKFAPEISQQKRVEIELLKEKLHGSKRRKLFTKVHLSQLCS